LRVCGRSMRTGNDVRLTRRRRALKGWPGADATKPFGKTRVARTPVVREAEIDIGKRHSEGNIRDTEAAINEILIAAIGLVGKAQSRGDL